MKVIYYARQYFNLILGCQEPVPKANNFLLLRKYSHIFFAFAVEFVPLLVNRFGDNALIRFIQASQEAISSSIPTIFIRPNRMVPIEVTIVDIERHAKHFCVLDGA